MGESEWSGQLGQWALAACLAWSSTLRSHPLPEERCSTLRNSDPPPSGAILYPEERCPPRNSGPPPSGAILCPEKRCSTLWNSGPPPSGAILCPEERCSTLWNSGPLPSGASQLNHWSDGSSSQFSWCLTGLPNQNMRDSFTGHAAKETEECPPRAWTRFLAVASA